MAPTDPTAAARRPPRRAVRCWAVLVAGVCLDVMAALDDRVGIDGRSTVPPAAPLLTTERSPLASATPAPLDAQGRTLGELAGVSYRWWSPPARSQVGVGLGAIGFVAPLGEDRGLAPGVLHGSLPTLTVGWRYRLSNDAAVYADATGAHSLVSDAMPGLYNTKLGVEWQPAKPRFGFENRSLGIQLQSGYRMSLRLRNGGVGLYFRGQF